MQNQNDQTHVKSNDQQNVQGAKAAWFGTRTFVTRRSTETRSGSLPVSNPFDPLNDSVANDETLPIRPHQRGGKKKATSPLDRDYTNKKQKEYVSDSENNEMENSVIMTCDTPDNVVIHNGITDNVNDTAVNSDNKTDNPTYIAETQHSRLVEEQLQMPTAVDSESLYYGPNARPDTEKTADTNLPTQTQNIPNSD